MDARLTPHNTQLLQGFADALDHAARQTVGGVRTFGATPHSDYQLGNRETLTYVADAIRTALTTDTSGPHQTAEDAATTIGRRALQRFLDQIHQPGVSTAILMHASDRASAEIVQTTTATALQNLLDDANLATPVAAEPEPTDMGVAFNSIGLRNFLNEAAVRGQHDITLLASGTPNRPSATTTTTVKTLRAALQDEPDTEPKTKPNDLGLPGEPDPYGIDLRGPHGTSRPAADRAIYGGLDDLDDRTRNLYRTLLRQTLTNLRNTDPDEDPL